MNQLEEKSFALLFEGKRLDPVSLDRNMVGFCSKCDSDLESLAYYSTESGWLVSTRCKKEHLALLRYDKEWNWLGDLELQITREKISVSDISTGEAGGGLHPGRDQGYAGLPAGLALYQAKCISCPGEVR